MRVAVHRQIAHNSKSFDPGVVYEVDEELGAQLLSLGAFIAPEPVVQAPKPVEAPKPVAAPAPRPRRVVAPYQIT